MCVEKRADFVAYVDQRLRVIGIHRVAVPCEEIQGQFLRAHKFQEAFAVRRRIERLGYGRTADQRFRVGLLDCVRDFFIEFVILLRRAGPEDSEIRLIPYLPIAQSVVKSVVPALVIVKHNVSGDLRVLVHVGRRCRIRADTAPNPKDRFRTHALDGVDQPIGRAKVVTFGIVGIGIHVRKDIQDIPLGGNTQRQILIGAEFRVNVARPHA